MSDVLLSGWGRTAPTRAHVVEVSDAAHVAAALLHAPARGLIARGLGRSYGDPAQNAGGDVLDITGLTGIALDAANGVATVAAGVSLDALMRECTPQGWWVPVTPGTRQVTVGGAIAADVHGKNHHVDGTFTAHVARMALNLPDGTLVDVYPGDALFNATAGGMGLTGVVVEADIQLLPITTALARVDTDRFDDLDSLMAAMASGDDQYRYSVAWVDAGTRGTLGRGILIRGDHANAADIPERKRTLAFDPGTLATVPALVPNGLLNKASITALNEAWFRKAPRQRRDELQSLTAFFHPLDMARDWNRMYGPRGFLQYQFVVPDSAGHVVQRTLEALRTIGATSFLTVLKRFGAEGPGLLSFPQPGWTLALDIPTGVPGLAPVLDRLDELVIEGGGRLYLAKDSRMTPRTLELTYPRLAQFRALRAEIDPNRRLNSDLARRLDL